MRIISQTRENDINYDNVMVCYEKYDGEHIVVAALDFFEESEKLCKLGTYSSKEKCLEVMQSIRERYNIGAKFYQMPEE